MTVLLGDAAIITHHSMQVADSPDLTAVIMFDSSNGFETIPKGLL